MQHEQEINDARQYYRWLLPDFRIPRWKKY